MDFLVILEQYGIPICVAIAFGFFIWRQNQFIQDTLMEELEESFTRLEQITIKLIDAQKRCQIHQAEVKAKIGAIIEIMASLSGNGLKKKFGKKKDNDGW